MMPSSTPKAKASPKGKKESSTYQMREEEGSDEQEEEGEGQGENPAMMRHFFQIVTVSKKGKKMQNQKTV